jgi:hypothetical protein
VFLGRFHLSGKRVTQACGLLPGSPLGRSRPAADASREVVERWLLDGLDVNVGHRRFPYDPFAKNDAGRAPAS